jgi:hypothetical protein
MSLALDHISLQAPRVDSAAPLLRDRFGLITTLTPAAPERHGRVYLDRSYLEVAMTRRTTPAEAARDWPPPLTAPHPCGATALAAVHLRVPRLESALEIYERLLGSPATKLGERHAVYRVHAGRVVLREATELPPAIVGFELRVVSLERTQRFLSALGTTTHHADGALWTDPPNGWRIGFCEAAADEAPRGVADRPALHPFAAAD